MAAQDVWNLMYVAGNPEIFSRVTANASNPMRRAEALKAANRVTANGWRVWVEHSVTGKRIFESAVEQTFQPSGAKQEECEMSEQSEYLDPVKAGAINPMHDLGGYPARLRNQMRRYRDITRAIGLGIIRRCSRMSVSDTVISD